MKWNYPMHNEPLTNEQIWGLPEDELPEPEPKDYFDLRTTEDIISDSVDINGLPPPDDSIIRGDQDV